MTPFAGGTSSSWCGGKGGKGGGAPPISAETSLLPVAVDTRGGSVPLMPSAGGASSSWGGGKGGKGGGAPPISAETSSFEAMILTMPVAVDTRACYSWSAERVPSGTVGGVFSRLSRGCVFWILSTWFFGGGRGDERQTRKHTFF